MAEIIQIDSNTWRFEDGFVRFFLLVGDDRAAMIDSGVNCPDAAALAKTVTDKPVILVNTHGDGDHTSGTAGFSEIHIFSEDYINCGIKQNFPETTLVELKDGQEIELGNRPLKIVHIPGHTSGSAAIIDVRKRVLYSGDSVQKGHIYMFGNKREPMNFEKSLEKLISLRSEYDRIYASHDEPIIEGDYAEKVLHSWKRVMNGEIPYESVNLFGNQVKSYTADYCGFYLE